MFESRKESPEGPKKIGIDGNEEQKPKKDLTFKVHTMPQKFQSQKSSAAFETPGKKKSSGGKIVLIIVIVVVVLGLGAVGYLLLTRDNGETPENTNSTNENTNITLNFSTNRNGNANTNATGANLNTNIANGNANTSNSNSNTNTSSKTLDALTLTQDLDGDFLTDAEEDSYGTNKTIKDTDEDTFEDANELLFGYSPLSKGKLEGSAAVDQYSNTSFGFSVLYPKGWTTQARGSDGRGVLFFPSSTTSGEFIEISVQDNFGRLTPEQWYRAQTSGANTAQLETETNWPETQSAVISPDGFSAYYGFGNYIYTIYYEVNDQDSVNYKTTFEMLRKSITFVAPVPTTNANINSNSNTNTTNGNSNTNSTNQNTNFDVTTNVP